MTTLQLEAVSKRFGYVWVVKNISFIVDNDCTFGISGRNGSGKSTIIKLISGLLRPTEGNITLSVSGIKITPTQFYLHQSLAAPYTDLIQEFTLREQFTFHNTFKPLKVTFSEFDNILQLGRSHHQKTMSEFSSGMRQKVMIALTLLSDVPLVLLDEPTAFLDVQAKSWFAALLHQYANDRIIIIASNDGFDLDLCSYIYNMSPQI